MQTRYANWQLEPAKPHGDRANERTITQVTASHILDNQLLIHYMQNATGVIVSLACSHSNAIKVSCELACVIFSFVQC